MKKAFKFLGTLAAVSAAVAGGVALYKKFFASDDDLSDLDDDFDDEFEDEDLDGETTAERGYVHIDTDTAEAPAEAAEEAAEAAEPAEASEEAPVATEEAAETAES